MKQIATMALMFSLAGAGVYAQENGGNVKLTFSGTAGASATDLKIDGTANGEYNYAGDGTLGRFTFRSVEAQKTIPEASDTCQDASRVLFLEVAGGGVFRFEDGSLLNVNLTHGTDCINFVALDAHCTFTFQITGGTGRFKAASGVLTLTEIVKPVVFDGSHKPAFFASTGHFTGTISGVRSEEDHQDEDE